MSHQGNFNRVARSPKLSANGRSIFQKKRLGLHIYFVDTICLKRKYKVLRKNRIGGSATHVGHSSPKLSQVGSTFGIASLLGGSSEALTSSLKYSRAGGGIASSRSSF
jgi:hypothetical protein